MTAVALARASTPSSAVAAWWEPRPEGTAFDRDIVALRAAILGDHPHRGMDFVAWIMSPDNPAGRGGAVILMRDDRLLGFAGATPRQMRLNGEDRTVLFGFDYMVARDIGSAASGRYAVRLAQLWNRLATERAADFCISYPNTNAKGLLMSRHVGWSVVGSPRLRLRPLGPRGGGQGPLWARLAAGLAGTAVDMASVARAGLERRDRTARLRGLDLGNPADRAAVDALWARRRDDMLVSLVRDAATLDWRYRRHPVHRYEILGIERDGALEGLVVTCRRDLFGLPTLLVVDGLLDPGNLPGNVTLLSFALGRGARAGAILALSEAMDGSTLARSLARCGFVTAPERLEPKRFLLTFRDGVSTSPLPRDAANWSFAWGDIDVV
jgi:hypothetical protein